MVDNSSDTRVEQVKLTGQLAAFVDSLEALPGGLPDLHVAVVSSDMGAPGDVTQSLGCTTAGDQGQFQFAARGDCLMGLNDGATFIATDGVTSNYTGQLADVLTCIATLGDTGCGFEHQLASVARALGADGLGPPPDTNAGFLRADAELAILLVSNEDDCSAPADTRLFSLNGGGQDNQNPLGPLANYRCNRWGHLCRDPRSANPDTPIMPPQTVADDATGNPPALPLSGCVSNDGPSGLLTPVRVFVDGIRALKSDPSRIVVGAIVAPPEPYAVAWVPPPSPSPGNAGELWPEVYHSCGPASSDGLNPAATQTTTDGSSGDPGFGLRSGCAPSATTES